MSYLREVLAPPVGKESTRNAVVDLQSRTRVTLADKPLAVSHYDVFVRRPADGVSDGHRRPYIALEESESTPFDAAIGT